MPLWDEETELSLLAESIRGEVFAGEYMTTSGTCEVDGSDRGARLSVLIVAALVEKVEVGKFNVGSSSSSLSAIIDLSSPDSSCV